MTLRYFTVLILLSVLVMPSLGQTPPKTELRGAWITTVINLDWPTNPNSSPSSQQAQLVALLDGLKVRGINTVFFQVRSEADAMYASTLEPWSRYLTGLQGRPPNPLWDPLEFAVEQAHARGMEIHAWLNPFRAVRDTGGGYAIAQNHVSRTHPEWILEIGSQKMLDPGHPEARAFIVEVIQDVVRRYNVDGIHFDDYFYPYSPVIGDQDASSYAAYNSGGLLRGDWRRDNINRFMIEVQTAAQAVDPEILFGVSPFGIWKPGVPEGINGLDAYNVLFADPLAWLADESVDYLVPQLYWPFGGGQDFGKLAPWWADRAQEAPNPRPIYVGQATYKVDTRFADCCYSANEMPRQIRFARATPGIEGSVHFRTQNLVTSTNQGLSDSLRTDLYRTKAFRPPMTHRDTFPPAAPENLQAVFANGTVLLTWDPSFFGTQARRFAVYRVIADVPPTDVRAITNNPEYLHAITYGPQFSEGFPVLTGSGGADVHYIVTALTFNNVESNESKVASVSTGTGTDGVALPMDVRLEVYPNPASTRLRIRLDGWRGAPAVIRIYDVRGRQVAEMTGEDVTWNLNAADGRRVAAGTYFVRVEGRPGAKPFIVSR